MNSTVADFEDKVVQRDPGRRIPYTKELTFKNDSKEGISWNMDDTSLRPVSTGDGGNITATSIWFVSPKVRHCEERSDEETLNNIIN